MSKDYGKHYNTKVTPQNEPIPSKVQIKNNAGGYVFGVDKWRQLDRFLILGSDGGSYYASERKLTIENANTVAECIKEDGRRVVDRVIEISYEGRAPSNDQALFVLAMCSSSDFADANTRRYAMGSLPKVARIGTHLFHYAEYVKGFRGWGRGLREAIARWYLDKSVENLAFQTIKYKQRDGWSHRDLLRLSHPKTIDPLKNDIFKYITDEDYKPETPILNIDKNITNMSEQEIVSAISEYRLPMEVIPTDKRTKGVYQEILKTAGLTWIIRNLGNLSKVGVLREDSWDNIELIQNRLLSEDVLKKARIHPLQILIALKTYSSGSGLRGSGRWRPCKDVVDILDKSFYRSFNAVEPTNKRYLLGIDVSGSMGWPGLAGMPITPREAAAAMSMVQYKTEKYVVPMAFAEDFRQLDFTRASTLKGVVDKIAIMKFGRTDCALPMLYAKENSLEIDVFIVYTDNETWYGDIHPCQALSQYRKESGIDAKLIVVGMTTNRFSIADPKDGNSLDVVGFDTSTPHIISEFALGNI